MSSQPAHTKVVFVYHFLFKAGSHSPGWPQTYHVAKDDLELGFSCLSLEIWYYRHEPPCLVYSMLEGEPRALGMLGSNLATG